MAKMAGEDKWREKFEREKKGRSNFNREQLLSSAPFRNCRQMAFFFTFFAVRLWSFCWRNDEKIQNLRVPYVSFFGRFSIFFTVPFLFFIFFTPAVFPMLSIAFSKRQQIQPRILLFCLLKASKQKMENFLVSFETSKFSQRNFSVFLCGAQLGVKLNRQKEGLVFRDEKH